MSILESLLSCIILWKKYFCNIFNLRKVATWMHSFPLILLWFKKYVKSNSYELWNNESRYEILHVHLKSGMLFYYSQWEPCNNQRPRCDIAWLHATNHLYHGSGVTRFNNFTFHVRLFNWNERRTTDMTLFIGPISVYISVTFYRIGY